MSSLEIKLVKTKRDRLVFIKMPWGIYKNDPYWVPPVIADQKAFLDPGKGVFYDHGEAELYLAYRNGVPVGRISAHLHFLHDQKYGDGKGFFGFFECEDNQETANALFRRAEDYLKGKNRTVCEGPLSFGIYDEVGILIKGFDSSPYMLNIHNPPYYKTLIERAGYEKSIDWYAYRGLLKDYDTLDKRLFRLRDRALSRAGLNIRKVNLGRLHEEAVIVKNLFDTAWDKNWGHVPLAEAEWRRLVHELARVAIPELTLIAEKNGSPAGFTLTLYDANVAVKQINGRLFPFGFLKLLGNLKKTKNIRFILMGVREEFRGRGIENALFLEVAQRAYEMGFTEMEMSLIVENNEAMIGSLKYFPVHIEKIYRLFENELK